MSNKITRKEKEIEIRKTFRDQPCGGWRAFEIQTYLSTLSIEMQPASKMTDDQIDLIYSDLAKAKML